MQLSQTTTDITSIQNGTVLQIDTIYSQNMDSILSIDSVFVPSYTSVSSEIRNTMVYQLKTVSIPLKFGYRFRFNKFHWMLGAGVQFNIPVSANAKVQSGEGFQTVYSSVKDSPYKSANMQLMLESEFHYKLNYHWSLSLTPSYRYQVSPIFKSKDVFVPNKHSGFLKLGVHYYF